MSTATLSASNEAQIRRLIEDRSKAVYAKDLDKLMAHHAPNVHAFDLLNTLQYRGSDTVRTRAKDWFEGYQGPIGYEIRDLNITADDHTAFAHYLYHVSGTMKNGTEVAMWVRTTVCFRKIDNQWKIIHEHGSVPFEVESGKAMLNLKPE